MRLLSDQMLLRKALGALSSPDLVKLNLEVLCHGQRLLMLILQNLFLLLYDLKTGKLRFTHFDRSLLIWLPCN